MLHEVSAGAPVFLTKNGRGKYAILDIRDFEEISNGQRHDGRLQVKEPEASYSVSKPNAKVYTIIGGVNGTGKSSLSGVLRTQAPDLGIMIDVDKITAENGGSAIQGGKIALEKIRDCLDNGVSFTQETTLSGRKTEITAQEARKRGYVVRLYYVGLDSVEECLRRIENRVAHGGHDIRETDVKRRFAGRWEAVAKVLPWCTEARFFDNYNGFSEVAEYRNGELIVRGNNPPRWAEELKAYLEENPLSQFR